MKLKHNRYMNSITENLRRNPKRFWGLAKMKNKNKRLPEMMFLDNVKVYTAQEKAILFNDYFKSVFTPTTDNENPFITKLYK